MVDYRTCTKCGVNLPATLEYFYKCSAVKSGLKAQCKKCNDVQKQDYRRRFPEKVKQHQKSWRDRNPEYKKNWYEAHPGYNQNYYVANKEHISIICRMWAVAHGEQVLAIKRKWAKNNREYKRVKSKEYYENNRDKYKVWALNRRSRANKLPNNFTLEDKSRMFDYWGHKCAVCGASEDFWTILALDHWQPVSKNGGSTPENMLPLCHPKGNGPIGIVACNLNKSAKDPEAWLIEKLGKAKGMQKLAEIEAYFEYAGGMTINDR